MKPIHCRDCGLLMSTEEEVDDHIADRSFGSCVPVKVEPQTPEEAARLRDENQRARDRFARSHDGAKMRDRVAALSSGGSR